MKSLELKIPPVLVAALVVGLQVLAARLLPVMQVDVLSRSEIAILFGLVGAAFIVLGVWEFRNSSTTINPHKPHNSSTMVRSGVYKWTRNPMYLGMAFLLVAGGVYLANALSIGLVWVFVAYLTRFQIGPEECELLRLFPDEFKSYCDQTRRWI